MAGGKTSSLDEKAIFLRGRPPHFSNLPGSIHTPTAHTHPSLGRRRPAVVLGGPVRAPAPDRSAVVVLVLSLVVRVRVRARGDGAHAPVLLLLLPSAVRHAHAAVAQGAEVVLLEGGVLVDLGGDALLRDERRGDVDPAGNEVAVVRDGPGAIDLSLTIEAITRFIVIEMRSLGGDEASWE